jgi:hypothetical protein
LCEKLQKSFVNFPPNLAEDFVSRQTEILEQLFIKLRQRICVTPNRNPCVTFHQTSAKILCHGEQKSLRNFSPNFGKDFVSNLTEIFRQLYVKLQQGICVKNYRNP